MFRNTGNVFVYRLFFFKGRGIRRRIKKERNLYTYKLNVNFNLKFSLFFLPMPNLNKRTNACTTTTKRKHARPLF